MDNINADSNFFEYVLSDFYLTAFLVCGHARLSKIRIVDEAKKKCEFVLVSNQRFEDVIRDYFNDKLSVNPQKYKDKIISLKSLLHETKDNLILNKNEV